VRGLVLLCLLPGVAQARDLPARSSVEREVGAETCAERAELERRVANILRRAADVDGDSEKLSIDVRFERASDGAFLARVSATGSKPGQRLLRDTGRPATRSARQSASFASCSTRRRRIRKPSWPQAVTRSWWPQTFFRATPNTSSALMLVDWVSFAPE
jgi:hypothetical protein